MDKLIPNIYQSGISQSINIYTDAVLASPYQTGNGCFMNIGERIEQIRKEKGLSREKLAEKLGVSTTTIFRKERGEGDSERRLFADELPDYAAALGVSLDYMMKGLQPRVKDSENSAFHLMAKYNSLTFDSASVGIDVTFPGIFQFGSEDAMSDRLVLELSHESISELLAALKVAQQALNLPEPTSKPRIVPGEPESN